MVALSKTGGQILPQALKTLSSTPSPTHLYELSANAKFSTSALKSLTMSGGPPGPGTGPPAPESADSEVRSRVSTAANARGYRLADMALNDWAYRSQLQELV